MSFLLEHRTQPCGALLWVDGEQFPAPTPSRLPHREVYVALLCASVLNSAAVQRKNGRLKNIQFSLFTHSHAYCHNKSKNWGAPRYKKVTIPLHPKSLLWACRAN